MNSSISVVTHARTSPFFALTFIVVFML